MPGLPPPLIATSPELLFESTPIIFHQKSPLHLRLLEKSDINQIIQLRTQVFHTLRLLSHEDYYIREKNEREFLLQHCGELGETLGVFSNQSLVAYGILGYHSILEGEDFRTKLQLSPTELFARAAQLSSCMVAHNFRHLGLHTLLIKKRMDLSIAKGYDCLVVAISSPNYASRENLFRAGFRIHWVGTPPNISIYYHMLHCNPKKINSHFNMTSQVEEVLSTDIAQQQKLLAQGYLGYANKKESYRNTESILFSRF